MEKLEELIKEMKEAESNCTAEGLSSKTDTMMLFCDCKREDAVAYCKRIGLEPSLQLILVRRELHWLKNADYAEPLVKPERKWNMFGGNFVYSSDSRFLEFTGSNRPIPVFDRIEENEC